MRTHPLPSLSEAHTATILVHRLQAVSRGGGDEDDVGHKLGGADDIHGGGTAVEQAGLPRLCYPSKGLQLSPVEDTVCFTKL